MKTEKQIEEIKFVVAQLWNLRLVIYDRLQQIEKKIKRMERNMKKEEDEDVEKNAE